MDYAITLINNCDDSHMSYMRVVIKLDAVSTHYIQYGQLTIPSALTTMNSQKIYDITLQGDGMATISGAASNDRFISIGTGSTLRVKHVVIRNFEVMSDGGAIFNEGNLFAESIQLLYNKALSGGAVFNSISGEIKMKSNKKSMIKNTAMNTGESILNNGVLTFDSCFVADYFYTEQNLIDGSAELSCSSDLIHDDLMTISSVNNYYYNSLLDGEFLKVEEKKKHDGLLFLYSLFTNKAKNSNTNASRAYNEKIASLFIVFNLLAVIVSSFYVVIMSIKTRNIQRQNYDQLPGGGQQRLDEMETQNAAASHEPLITRVIVTELSI